jgi:hypothetical protein
MLNIHIGRKADSPRALPEIAFSWLDARGRGRRRRRDQWSALHRSADAKHFQADARRIQRQMKKRYETGAFDILGLQAIPNQHLRRSSAMRRLATTLIVVAGAAALVRFTVVPWARNWGRGADDGAPLPGDDLVDEATAIETRSNRYQRHAG